MSDTRATLSGSKVKKPNQTKQTNKTNKKPYHKTKGQNKLKATQGFTYTKCQALE